jgi:hypothetical protein
MKTFAIVLSLAVAGVVLSSNFTAASATRMNGKCCQSSDGGRSYKARVALRRLAIPHTCSAYAASCMRVAARKGDGARLCQAAKTQCLQTGVHVGPYSHMQIAGMEKR